MSDVEVEVESGLGGRLLFRAILGGAGKAPMLVVFRTVLPGVGRAEIGGDIAPEPGIRLTPEVLSVGTAGVDCVLVGRGVGRPEDVTARVSGLPAGVAIDEAEDAGRDSGSSGMSGSGFLVFVMGRAGNGPDGGAEGGGLR